MVPNGSHPLSPFAMNQNNDASLSFNQVFPQDQPLLDSNIQAQRLQQQVLSNVMAQNPMNPWQQTQLTMSANQPLPALSMLSQQPQLGQLPWATQMSNPQQLQNAMLQMAPFNMPLLSQQIIQEAFSMSQPVDAADEPILLTALLKAKKSERNFKEALNGLHGTNGHSASLWKDYYLEHKDRLDDWIEKCMKKEDNHDKTQVSLVTLKKPSPASFKALSKSSSRQPSVKPQKTKASLPSRSIPTLEGRGRHTMNSLSVPDPIFGSRLPAPNAALRVPDPPSRSPTPPTHIVPQRRGNKFTTEDREFFIKFIGWRLRQNPELSRQELYEMLAEKAPHHSAGSWATFWSNHHDLPDKILAAARGEIAESDHESEGPTKNSRPNYKDVSTSEDEHEEEEWEQEREQDDSGDESGSSTEPVRRYSVSDMGERNGPFTNADLYITAKYIASRADWGTLTAKHRWEPFNAKHPQRTAKSWGEYYRRHEKSLLKLAKKIRRENPSSIMSQSGRPSKIPPKAKRRLSDENDEDEVTSKRTRTEESQ